MAVPMWVKMIGLWTGLVVATVAIGLAIFVFRRGLIASLLWIVGLLAAAVGVVNRLSYGR